MSVINNIIVEIDGIPNTGKTTLSNYIKMLSTNTIAIRDTGIISAMVNNDKEHTENTFVLPYKPFIVLLTSNDDDQNIKNKLVGLEYNLKAAKHIYMKYANQLSAHGISVYMYNVSEMSLYKIAKDIIDKVNNIELSDYIIIKPIVIKPLYIS